MKNLTSFLICFLMLAIVPAMAQDHAKGGSAKGNTKTHMIRRVVMVDRITILKSADSTVTWELDQAEGKGFKVEFKAEENGGKGDPLEGSKHSTDGSILTCKIKKNAQKGTYKYHIFLRQSKEEVSASQADFTFNPKEVTPPEMVIQ